MQNYSTTFYAIAVGALDRATRYAEENGRWHDYSQHVVEVVTLCAMALEAGINEVASWPECSARMPERFEAFNLEQKWSLVPLLLKDVGYQTGEAPWQDFVALIGLRNALVHFKWNGKVGRPWAHLVSRKLIIENTVDEVSSSMTVRVGRWACDVVAAMFAELARLIGRDTDRGWLWGPEGFPSVERLEAEKKRG